MGDVGGQGCVFRGVADGPRDAVEASATCSALTRKGRSWFWRGTGLARDVLDSRVAPARSGRRSRHATSHLPDRI